MTPGPVTLAALIGFVAGMFAQMAICTAWKHHRDIERADCTRTEHVRPRPGIEPEPRT